MKAHGGSSSAQNHPTQAEMGTSFGLIRDLLIHSLAATKMIFLQRFHADPLRGNKERVAISQICVFGMGGSLCWALITLMHALLSLTSIFTFSIL